MHNSSTKKLGNVRIAQKFLGFRQNLTCSNGASGVRVACGQWFCVGGVSGAFMAGRLHHNGGSPPWLHGWLGIPSVTMVTKVAWVFPTRGFHIQSLLRAKTHIGLHVMFALFLPVFNKNWNVYTNFKKI
jgi:hypothetical protein